MTRWLVSFFLCSSLFGAQEWYVDSVRGDDRSTGDRADRPFRTIAKLRATRLTGDSVIHLARGSHWREELRELPEGTVVQAYGDGPRPLLDASDVAPAERWVSDGGLYRISWTHQMTEANKSLFSVWENGLRLRRTASLSETREKKGSFFAETPVPGQAGEIWMNPSGAINERVYEISRRDSGLTLPDRGRAFGIHTRRNGNNNGSLAGARDVFFKDCLAEDGTVHNVFLNSGVVEDVVASGSEVYDIAGSSSMFVSYAQSAGGMGVVYRRAKAIGGDPSRPNELGGSLGFFQHVNPGGVNYSYLVFEDCEVSDLAVGFAGIAEQVLVTGGSASRVYWAIYAEATRVEYVLGFRANGDDPDIQMSRVVHGPAPRTYVHRLDAVARLSSGGLLWLNGSVDVSSSSLRFVNKIHNANVGIKVDSGALRVAATILQGAETPIEVDPSVSLTMQ